MSDTSICVIRRLRGRAMGLAVVGTSLVLAAPIPATGVAGQATSRGLVRPVPVFQAASLPPGQGSSFRSIIPNCLNSVASGTNHLTCSAHRAPHRRHSRWLRRLLPVRHPK